MILCIHVKQPKIEPTNRITQQPWYKRLIQFLLFRTEQVTDITCVITQHGTGKSNHNNVFYSIINHLPRE